jgi:hypothetical protein
MDQKQNDRVYYSKVNLMKRAKNAPLSDAIFTVSGDVSFAEKKSGQYGDFITVTLTAVLPDKSVERHFGKELVNADHKVDFRFNLSGFPAQNFIEHTPRWGQDIIFMLYDMKVDEFTRRDGTKGYNVSAKCAGFNAIGSLKKADGSDRPAIRIKGLDEADAAAKPAPAAQTVQEAMSNLNIEFEDDDELPF